jgi:Cdc6-like AAA superfamily ATPase
MDSSGDTFVDARRTDAIEYCFRMKGDLIGDLRKAKHCIEAAIEQLEARSKSALGASERGS